MAVRPRVRVAEKFQKTGITPARLNRATGRRRCYNASSSDLVREARTESLRKKTMSPPFGMEPEVETAMQLLLQGATRGMVVGHLEQQGVPAHQCAPILDAAQKIVHRRERVTGCLLTVVGLLVTAVGIFVHLQFPGGRFSLGVTIAMTGLIFTLYGCSETLRKRN